MIRKGVCSGCGAGKRERRARREQERNQAVCPAHHAARVRKQRRHSESCCATAAALFVCLDASANTVEFKIMIQRSTIQIRSIP